LRWYPQSWRAPLVRAARNGLLKALAHILVLLGGYEVFRAISVDSPRVTAQAHAHAASLIDLERRFGLFIEPRLQHLALHHGSLGVSGFLDGPAIGHLTALVYGGSQLYWLTAMLLWLYLFRREHFTYVRNLIVTTTLAAGIFSAWYAVAPPRFALAGPPYWIEDVLHPHQSEALLIRQAALDPYASLPSGHTLWALLTGLGLALGAAGLVQRMLAMLFPLGIVLTVVITGNHYVFDCLGAAALLLACIGLGLLVRRFARGRQVHGAADHSALHRLGMERRKTDRGEERRKNPNLRPLDHPLILCATIAVLLLVSFDMAQRLVGLALLVGAAIMLPLARHRARIGTPLRGYAEKADWWCGFFFVAGSTTVGADDPWARLCGSFLWVAAGVLPILARMRHAADAPAPSAGQVQPPHRSWWPAFS